MDGKERGHDTLTSDGELGLKIDSVILTDLWKGTFEKISEFKRM
jgi:hypothetical protein